MKPWFNRSRMKRGVAKRVLFGALGAAVLIGGLSACAQHAPWSDAPRSEAEQAEWRAKMVDRVARKLDLDIAQKARLEALAATLAAQRQRTIGSASPKAEMQAILANSRFDRERAQSFVTGRVSALQEASPPVLDALADFYNSLRPEQQQQVRDLLSRMGAGYGHGWRG